MDCLLAGPESARRAETWQQEVWQTQHLWHERFPTARPDPAKYDVSGMTSFQNPGSLGSWRLTLLINRCCRTRKPAWNAGSNSSHCGLIGARIAVVVFPCDGNFVASLGTFNGEL